VRIKVHKLQDVQFGTQWFDEIEDRWDYDDFQAHPEWRRGWISMDCALYHAPEDRVYLGITSFDADIFKAFDRRTGGFVDLGYRAVADPFDAKFHRSLVLANDGCIYAAVALLHDVDRWLEAPGSPIIRYDPRCGRIQRMAPPLPHVYIQSLAVDNDRELVYGLCFPPEKLISYSLRTGQVTDLGLIGTGAGGMAQGENIVVDDEGCVWSNWQLTRAWQNAPGRDAARLCKYDPHASRTIFYREGLPRPDGAPGTVGAEAFFNFHDGFIYASGAAGSLYRVDTRTADATFLFTPTPDRPSRLSSLAGAEDGVAYGITGRAGRCELMRVHYREGAFEKLGEVRDDRGNVLWQCHDIVRTSDGVLYVCENDNPYRSGYLWEIEL
jgi:hypothetical protein